MLKNQVRHQATRKVNYYPGDCRWSLNLPLEFVWVCMGYKTHLITPEGPFYSFRPINNIIYCNLSVSVTNTDELTSVIFVYKALH